MGNGNLEKLSSIHNVNTPTSGEHTTQHNTDISDNYEALQPEESLQHLAQE